MAEHDMNNRPDDLAADYVLGVLAPDERAAIEARMKTDSALAAAVGAWQTRLEPLLDTVAPVLVPQGNLDRVWQKIAAQQGRGKIAVSTSAIESESAGAAGVSDVAGGTPGANPAAVSGPAVSDPGDSDRQTAQIITLQRRVTRWKRAALAAGAIAASLVLYVAAARLPINPAVDVQGESSFVAILQSADKTAHFVASVDIKTGRIDMLRMGPGPAGGKAYELWAVGGASAKPLSLGLITGGAAVSAQILKRRNEAALRKTVLAVSLEPAGGSPTGQPTGPVLFTGKLVPFAGQ